MAALAREGHEICPHGHRWLDYSDVDVDTDRAHIARTVEASRTVTGQRPLGWYTGRMSQNTRGLLAEDGGFLYDSDDYSDDLPFWTYVSGIPHLVIPYSLDVNDMRFVGSPGFATAGSSSTTRGTPPTSSTRRARSCRG